MKILLMTPPLTQFNTPYPATAYLMGFLKQHTTHAVSQVDVSLDWILELLKPAQLDRLRDCIQAQPQWLNKSPYVTHFCKHFESIRREIKTAVHVLQGKPTGKTHLIAALQCFPLGPRLSSFGPTDPIQKQEFLDFSFGAHGILDKALFLATLMVEEVVAVYTDTVEPHLSMARYGESLAASMHHFDALEQAIHQPLNIATEALELLCNQYITQYSPDLLAITVPFPGNLLGALRIAHFFKRHLPCCKIVMGGGYVNTELRWVQDTRLFNYIDALTLDDGERPLQQLIHYFSGQCDKQSLLRTKLCEYGKIIDYSSPNVADPPFKETATPTYHGLHLDNYLSILEVLNPMHRLWSDSRWNKLTVAHGCYWKKCAFCDVSLDYIARYEPLSAPLLADRIQALIDETGFFGFHFVDEAAPPAVLKSLAQELLRRKISIAWWGNVRFEKTFDKALCELLRASGCVALTGGLEVASDRLLKLMQKGVSVEQVARVTHAMNQSGIMVHAYLMYGFPSQTEQETIDSLEMVRQLFVNGCLDSAFWHRFSLTVHAPIAKDPKQYGLKVLSQEIPAFAHNDLDFIDTQGCDPALYRQGLERALYNYMHGMCLEEDVRSFFDFKIKKTRIHKDFITNALNKF